jgi:acetyltransferase
MLSSFFNPSSVAVVGASDDTHKLRGKLLQLLRQSYAGPIYPVHPTAASIQGLAAVPDVGAIRGDIDLVVIATPGPTVATILGQAAAAGARAAVVLSSGVDSRASAAAVGSRRLRWMGPNSEGYFITAGPAVTFSGVAERVISEGRRTRPAGGQPISIVSQSGGLGFALYGRALADHLDIHAVLTTGNEGDLDCLDCVEFLLEEGRSGALLMFIEGLKHPTRFASVASRAADLGVPLIVMKVGSSEAGQRAAVSHTAHLTGSDTAYDAVFKRYGVTRAHDLEEVLATAAAFSRLPRTPVRNTAIVTTSGGAGAWAADLCAREAIEVPVLSASLREKLSQHVPAFGSTANPIDVTAAVVEDGGVNLARVLEHLQTSDEVDSVIVNMGLATTDRVQGLSSVLGPLLAAPRKPILFHSHMMADTGNPLALSQLGGHMFPSLRGCALALRAVDRYANFKKLWRNLERPPSAAPTLPPGLRGVLDNTATRKLLEAYDVPVPATFLVQSRAAAIAAATQIGCPVVLKIQSPDIPHKTEAGAVATNVGAAQVGETYDRIRSNAAAYAPQARLEGVLVQRMMPKGHELVIGVIQDRDFGPLVMLGSGGIYLEVLKEVTFAPAPISHQVAHQMIEELRIAPILKGVRGAEPSDIDALAVLLTRVGQLAWAESSRLSQLDLNPVFVYGAGEGVVAVDALAVAAG